MLEVLIGGGETGGIMWNPLDCPSCPAAQGLPCVRGDRKADTIDYYCHPLLSGYYTIW